MAPVVIVDPDSHDLLIEALREYRQASDLMAAARQRSLTLPELKEALRRYEDAARNLAAVADIALMVES